MPNALKQLNDFGQSPWLDFVSRDLLRSGQLSKMIEDDGLKGVTSNPSIFEKAIGHGDDYDEMIREAEAAGDLDPGALFEGLAVHEIQNGADAMRRVYQQTHGRDGSYNQQVMTVTNDWNDHDATQPLRILLTGTVGDGEILESHSGRDSALSATLPLCTAK